MNRKQIEKSIPVDALKTVLSSQFHSSLNTLEDTITKCPDELWYDSTKGSAFWQIAYHTLFFAHMYSEISEATFEPWKKHQKDVQFYDAVPGPEDPESSLPLLPQPYSKNDALEYVNHCRSVFDRCINEMDLSSESSGFWWYKISKLEHQIVNIRHVQHHAAQLADRLRTRCNIGISWFGAVKRNKVD